MRSFTAVLLAPCALALIGGAALAQTRYGPPSAIPPAPPLAMSGGTLNWPGKTVVQTAPDPAQAVGRPQALSAWARNQVASQPAPAAPLALPPSMPAPMAAAPASQSILPPLVAPQPAPTQVAVAPPPARLPPLPAAPALPAPAPQPAAAPAPAPAPAPASAPASAPAPAAMAPQAPPPQASQPRSYPGYGVPQIQSYPGYDSGQAPAAAAPPPAPQAAAQGGQGARLYSVAREFGLTPDPIPPPTQLYGEGINLSEVPAGAALAQEDDTDYQPRRSAPGDPGRT